MTYRTIRGTTMEAGYRTDGPRRLRVVVTPTGSVLAWSLEDGMGCELDPPLVVDVDGQITREGATAGYGFLPDEGELERVRALGVVFPARVS